MEEYSYTSTHPLGHTGPVTGSLLPAAAASIAVGEVIAVEVE